MRPEKSDIATVARDLAYAVALLSRVPLPVDLSGAAKRGAASAWAWPLAGLVVALIAGGLGAALGASGLPPGLVAGLVLAASILLTGAMHEDGLADTADGLWGGFDRVRRLDIMKDSRIGTYGVLALAISVLLRWQALTILATAGGLWAALVAAALLSRAPMAVVMAAMPPARADGLSRSVGRPSGAAAAIGVAIALGGALAVVGMAAVWPFVAVVAVTAAIMALARAKIGGQTGDILGAVQQISDIAVLAILAAAV